MAPHTSDNTGRSTCNTGSSCYLMTSLQSVHMGQDTVIGNVHLSQKWETDDITQANNTESP